MKSNILECCMFKSNFFGHSIKIFVILFFCISLFFSFSEQKKVLVKNNAILIELTNVTIFFVFVCVCVFFVVVSRLRFSTPHTEWNVHSQNVAIKLDILSHWQIFFFVFFFLLKSLIKTSFLSSTCNKSTQLKSLFNSSA